MSDLQKAVIDQNGVVEQKNLSLVKLGMSLKISSESRIPVSQTWRGAETSSDFHNPNRADMRLFNKADQNSRSLSSREKGKIRCGMTDLHFGTVI